MRYGWALAVLLLSAGCEPSAAPPDDAAPPSDGSLDDAAADARLPVDAGPPAPELDRDGDGIDDLDDAFPDDPAEWLDSDGDGVGNATDADEDGDGTPDELDDLPFDPAATRFPEASHPSDTTVLEVGTTPPLRIRAALGDGRGLFAANVGVRASVPLSLRVDAPAAVHAEIFARYAGDVGPDEPFDPVDTPEPGVTIYAWLPPRDGTVTLSVLIERGPASGELTLLVVPDHDLDGIGDERERALGLREACGDPDEDGILDGTEWPLSRHDDVDGDGFPSWLDVDGDGDTLGDRVEGWRDTDGDGLVDMLDTDADGNGTPDATEPGVAEGAPLDADGDGDGAWRDLDDDGDGLLDVRDPDPDVPARLAEGLERDGDPLVVERTEGTFAGGARQVPDAVRVGEPLTIHGRGFGGAPLALLLYEDGAIENLDVVVRGPTEATITPARSGAAVLRVVAGDFATTPRALDVLGPDAPVLYPPADAAFDPWLLFLEVDGENLDVDELHVETDLGELLSHSVSAPGRLRVDATDPIRGTQIRARWLRGWSNRIAVRPRRTQFARVTLPAGAVFAEADLTMSAGSHEEVGAPAFGDWRLSGRDDTAMTIVATAPRGASGDRDPVLMAIGLPSAAVPTLDADGTAATLCLQLDGATARLPASELVPAFDEARALAEVQALGAVIEAEATSRTDYLVAPSPAFTSALGPALEAVEAIVAARVSVPPMAIRALGEVTPGEQHDVMVYQTAGTGDLSVENDTSLYLSAEVRDRAERPLQAHATSYADLRLISPQRGLFLAFAASTGGLSAPGYRSATIDVVTPGIADPQPSDARGRDAQFWVRLRTLVDRVFLPVVSEAVGWRFNPGTFVSLLFVHNYDAIQDARSAWASGRIQDGLWIVANAILRDVEGLGPLTRAIVLSALGTTRAEAIAAFARSFLPFISGAERLLQAVSTVGALTGIGKAIDDVRTTPGVLTWSIDFGLELTRAEPASLERRRRRQEVCLDGVGLRRGDGSPVELSIRDGATSGTIAPREVWARSDGGRLCFAIAPTDGALLVGPIEVEVRDPDTDERASISIPAYSTLYATRLSTGTLTARDRVRLYGAGFGSDAARLEVRFRDGEEGPVVATARALDASPRQIDFEVPAALETGRAYYVFAVLDPDGTSESTNEIPTGIEYPDVRGGTWRIQWRAREARLSDCSWHEGALLYSLTPATVFHSPWGSWALGVPNDCTVSPDVTMGPGTADDGVVFFQPGYGGSGDVVIGCNWQWEGAPFGGFSGRLRRNRIRYQVAGGTSCSGGVHWWVAEYTPPR